MPEFASTHRRAGHGEVDWSEGRIDDHVQRSHFLPDPFDLQRFKHQMLGPGSEFDVKLKPGCFMRTAGLKMVREIAAQKTKRSGNNPRTDAQPQISKASAQFRHQPALDRMPARRQDCVRPRRVDLQEADRCFDHGRWTIPRSFAFNPTTPRG